ncbi:hypothetical protein P154DRAFT_527397 [Amniculicola lignicola CBS 123094]|uniref:tRNA-splicing endonuclease subunit Sen2 n=1 Tax=Amniculicola lignicola CBS 123094 TaxID=1392246 RepID=A0A6A5VZ83_9PLEO|nr:hypothetical protein P154DRAFT_527397 [Amniculicola lignicola CBS 123094]
MTSRATTTEMSPAMVMADRSSPREHLNPPPSTPPKDDSVPNGSPSRAINNATPRAINNATPQSAVKPSPGPAKPRTKRPNYNEIHRRPLPLNVHPLPAFLPHNPLSIVRIAIAMLSHSLWPPKSQLSIHKAYFSAETQSIHVTDPESIRALWEQGFFGTGSLSRSEPQWLDHEKRRRGIAASLTSAEVTRNRREERQQFKLERARLQIETIEEQLRREGKLATEAEPDLDAALDDPRDPSQDENAPTAPVLVRDAPPTLGDVNAATLAPESTPPIPNQEHLQLSLEEAFFLVYVLSAISITLSPASIDLLSSPSLFRLLATHSTFPPSTSPSPTQNPTHNQSIAPDNPFLLKYVVYHHFRSLGWVVRSGVKFACDYLIYNRGPAFTHAQFAVIIIPAYSHPYWSETEERRKEVRGKGGRDWWWLHRANRVQTQVMKTLVLVYVEVPPPWDGDREGKGVVDVRDVLKRYRVRETVWRRWSPKKME